MEEALADAQRRVLSSRDADDNDGDRPAAQTPLWVGMNVVVSRNDVRLDRRERMVARMVQKVMESVKDVAVADEGVEEGRGRKLYGDYTNGIGVLYNVINDAWKRIQQVNIGGLIQLEHLNFLKCLAGRSLL